MCKLIFIPETDIIPLTKTKNGVESIGKAVFRVCSNLTSIAIPDGDEEH